MTCRRVAAALGKRSQLDLEPSQAVTAEVAAGRMNVRGVLGLGVVALADKGGERSGDEFLEWDEG